MSAYSHQMEREFSGLSSRANSELGSQYSIESGFYMSSLTATIFLACLATLGVLMITLLVALSVMLQSCETKSAGIVEEMQKSTDEFSFCKMFALHAEISGLEAADFPEFCRDAAVRYIREGFYLRELNFSIQMAERYFGSRKLSGDGLDAVVMDLDDIYAQRSDQDLYYDFMEEAKHQKEKLTLELYSKLRSKGYSLVLSSREFKNKNNSTTEQLVFAGYTGWSDLISWPDDEENSDGREHSLRRKLMTEKQGLRILGVIGSRMDVLSGPLLGTRVFRLPSCVLWRGRLHERREGS